MKSLLIIVDGMSDEPLARFGGRTPLGAAATPGMDALARAGRCGWLHTAVEGRAPGSETAILSLLGYHRSVFPAGRGALEALGMGVPLSSGELALRANLLSLDDRGRLLNHNAGGISTPEAAELIGALKDRFDDDALSLHRGESFRHTLCLRSGSPAIVCTPPQQILGRRWTDYPVEAHDESAGRSARRLNALIGASRELFVQHPVNLRRRARGAATADLLWPWSPGLRPMLRPLGAIFGFGRGSVVAGVPLIRGIGAAAGLRVVRVEGATGYTDTDYAAKAAAALRSLSTDDFVLLHIEAPDECSHERDAEAKVASIEAIDRLIVAPLFEALQAQDEPFTLALLPDHPTHCRTGEHGPSPVPFALFRRGTPPDPVERFDEEAAAAGSAGTLHGEGFARLFFGR